MAMTRTQQLAVGGAVLVAGVLAVVSVRGFGHTTIKITFRPGTTGDCVILKQDAHTKKDKKIRWDIDRGCLPDGTLVSVGNFRTTERSTAQGCGDATEGGAEWPFREPAQEFSRRQDTKKIELKVKKREDLPGARDYFYDVCTGQNGERKWDPRLVIEQ